jgi:type IV pilus assembly protein PilZ
MNASFLKPMAKDNQARSPDLPASADSPPRLDAPRPGSAKPGLLTLTIKDKSALYLAYMPFVSNGGLFIPTNSNYRIGDEVFMLLNLMGEDEKLPVAGRVIWVTPKGAQGKRTAGIGVQFSDQDRGQTRHKIENYLAGALSGDKATHTM